MQNLWKKEKTQSGMQYIDLFAELKKRRITFQIIDGNLDSLCNKSDLQSIDFRNRGNDEYQLGMWSNAMNFYNKSLCFAEIGSENIALAIAHRSACFFNMQKYKEALFDIERIKNANLSEDLRKELEERKRQCENLMDKQMLENPPKLSYEADKNYPSVANVLELKDSKEFGRHFVAKCDIPIGKIVLEEKGFIGIRKDIKSMCCSECLRLHSNFIPCQCATTVFCCKECIAKNTTHKWECGTYFNLFDPEIKFQVQAIFLAIDTFHNIAELMQFIENILNDPENQLPKSLHDAKSKYHFFFKLSKSMPDADDIFLVYKIYIDLMKIPKIVALFDSNEKQRFLSHLIAHHFLVILNNAHGCESYQSLGVMFSMFNHTCAPNLLQFFNGKQYMVTIRPVKKGDQLFISYVGRDKQHFEQRKEIFKSKWNFICNCERCNPVDSTIDQDIIFSDPHFQFIFKYGYIADKSSAILNHCVHFLNKFGQSPWFHEFQFVLDIYCAHLAMNNLNHSLEV